MGDCLVEQWCTPLIWTFGHIRSKKDVEYIRTQLLLGSAKMQRTFERTGKKEEPFFKFASQDLC